MEMEKTLSQWTHWSLVVDVLKEDVVELPVVIEWVIDNPKDIVRLKHGILSSQTVSNLLLGPDYKARQYCAQFLMLCALSTVLSDSPSEAAEAATTFAYYLGLTYTDCRLISSIWNIQRGRKDLVNDQTLLTNEIPIGWRSPLLRLFLTKDVDPLNLVRFFRLDTPGDMEHNTAIIQTLCNADQLYGALQFTRRCYASTSELSGTISGYLLIKLQDVCRKAGKLVDFCSLPFHKGELDQLLKQPDYEPLLALNNSIIPGDLDKKLSSDYQRGLLQLIQQPDTYL